MSCQRGNASRTRPQKYKNKTGFKNNLHDTSQSTKLLNSLDFTEVCERCKSILEWKVKYKKYKALNGPKTCTKCHQKSVIHAYRLMCNSCANSLGLCSKCGKTEIESKLAEKEEDGESESTSDD